MVNKEQAILWEAALRALGRALRHEFENNPQDMPHKLRVLLDQLERQEKQKSEEKSD
jgi:hypothetical protein